MQQNNTGRTPAQLAVFHTAESVGLSAIITLISGIYQGVVMHGFNLPVLGSIAGVAFLGAFATIWRSLATNPNLAPAAADTEKQVQAWTEQLVASHQNLSNILQQFMNALNTTPPASQPPASSQAPVQQQQFQQTPWQQQETPFLGRANTANTMPTTTFPVPIVTKQ